MTKNMKLLCALTAGTVAGIFTYFEPMIALKVIDLIKSNPWDTEFKELWK